MSGSAQVELIVPDTGPNVFAIVARHSGKCLDVPGASTTDGTRLQQWSCNNSAAQSFRLSAQP